ncbi:MAG: hypothetical protein ABIP20_06710 [Chthoniobacteraceae bacterium]
MKTRISILIAAFFAAFLSITHAEPAGLQYGEWTKHFDNRVTTKKAAEACCLPTEKVALVCKDCKTANEKGGADKKGILHWFTADSTHDCSGCGGKITVRQIPLGQGTAASIGEYQHLCSKCGDKSALICATHK